MHDVRVLQAHGPAGGDAAAQSAKAPAIKDHGPVLVRPDQLLQAITFFARELQLPIAPANLIGRFDTAEELVQAVLQHSPRMPERIRAVRGRQPSGK